MSQKDNIIKEEAIERKQKLDQADIEIKQLQQQLQTMAESKSGVESVTATLEKQHTEQINTLRQRISVLEEDVDKHQEKERNL